MSTKTEVYLMKKNTKKRLLWTSSILAFVLILVSFFGIYVSDYYHADKNAIAKFSHSESVMVKQIEEGVISYVPEDVTAGFIFYPGGKVEYTAYEPFMISCAEQGLLCVLLEMPFNLAVLDINAADGIKEHFPEIDTWYIGGHSLGGSMAASYLSENTNDFDGLILLASYSTEDFSNSNIHVLSVYGSEDKVLNMDKYNEYESNLPANFEEYVIEGGCHAYFGMYGTQDGDGKPTIQNEEQIQMAAKKIVEEIKNKCAD